MACDHKGIGQPNCPTCDVRTAREGGPRCNICQKRPARSDGICQRCTDEGWDGGEPPMPGSDQFAPGHWTCPRCCKPGERLCCELSRETCEACGGEGSVLDVDEDGEEEFLVCEACGGAGGVWVCGCDENGNHPPRATPAH